MTSESLLLRLRPGPPAWVLAALVFLAACGSMDVDTSTPAEQFASDSTPLLEPTHTPPSTDATAPTPAPNLTQMRKTEPTAITTPTATPTREATLTPHAPDNKPASGPTLSSASVQPTDPTPIRTSTPVPTPRPTSSPTLEPAATSTPTPTPTVEPTPHFFTNARFDCYTRSHGNVSPAQAGLNMTRREKTGTAATSTRGERPRTSLKRLADRTKTVTVWTVTKTG